MQTLELEGLDSSSFEKAPKDDNFGGFCSQFIVAVERGKNRTVPMQIKKNLMALVVVLTVAPAQIRGP